MKLTPAEQRALAKLNKVQDNTRALPVIRPLKLQGFSRLCVLDEQNNRTGTHKDRLASHLMNLYHRVLYAKKEGSWNGPLPHLSIISAGSAANAIQTQLRDFGLPRLKVLVDSSRLEKRVLDHLADIGCELFPVDLKAKFYTHKDILETTNNPTGYVATSKKITNGCYHLLAHVLLLQASGGNWYAETGKNKLIPLNYPQFGSLISRDPAFIFMPFGTGRLYEDIVEYGKFHVFRQSEGMFDNEQLKHCSYIGATTDDPRSKADKLYTPFREEDPASDRLLASLEDWNRWIQMYTAGGYCGKHSQIRVLKEEYLPEAQKVFSRQGIVAEPSGAAGLALLLQMQDEKKLPAYAKDAAIVVVNTGKTELGKR